MDPISQVVWTSEDIAEDLERQWFAPPIVDEPIDWYAEVGLQRPFAGD